MAYELQNNQIHRIACTFGPPIGTINIDPGECVPTPEMEAVGLKEADFKDFVKLSCLRKVPEREIKLRLAQEDTFQAEEDAQSEVAEAPTEPRGKTEKKSSKGSKKDSSKKKENGGDKQEPIVDQAPKTPPVPEPAGDPMDILKQVKATQKALKEEELQKSADLSCSSYKGAVSK